MTWLGRPSIAAEGIVRVGGGRNVVIASLVDTDGDVNTAEQVALTISNDGGQTFIQTVPLNAVGVCASGLQDFPSVTFDHSTNPPTGYAVWRNKRESSFGGCIQAFMLDKDGTPTLLGSTHGIDNMDREYGTSNEGQGFLKVLAADGVATVIYANDDSLGDHVCGAPGALTTSDIAWGAVSTFDGGASWNDHSHVFETHDFVWCAFGGTVQRGLKEFDGAMGPDGNLFVIVTSAEGEARLFVSATRGVERNNSPAWREYCPGSQPLSGGPTSRWTAPGATCAMGAFTAATIIHPTLGFDTNGRLVVSFYHEREPGSQELQFFVKTITAPRGAVDGISDFQDEVSPDDPFQPSDFEAIGYEPNDPNYPFQDVQSANALGWQNAVVSAGVIQPFPQGTREVFALWTSILDRAPIVRSARIEFTAAQ